MNRCLHKDPYKLSNFSTNLSTCHHGPVQHHDVLLDPVQANDAQPALATAHDHKPDLVQPHDILLAPVRPNDPLQDPVQTLNLQPAPVHSHVVQPVPDQLADADVVDQEPPEPPDLEVLRRSRRVCKRDLPA